MLSELIREGRLPQNLYVFHVPLALETTDDSDVDRDRNIKKCKTMMLTSFHSNLQECRGRNRSIILEEFSDSNRIATLTIFLYF